MKKYGEMLAIGMMLLLLGVMGTGCDSKEKEKERERENERLKMSIKELQDENKRLEDMNTILWVALPTTTLIAFFWGTSMGLKGKKDSQHVPMADNRTDDRRDDCGCREPQVQITDNRTNERRRDRGRRAKQVQMADKRNNGRRGGRGRRA